MSGGGLGIENSQEDEPMRTTLLPTGAQRDRSRGAHRYRACARASRAPHHRSSPRRRARTGGKTRHASCKQLLLLRLFFVLEGPLSSRGWYQRPLSQSKGIVPVGRGGDVVEGARAIGPLAADLSSESPLGRFEGTQVALSVDLSPKLQVRESLAKAFFALCSAEVRCGRFGYK